MVRIDQYIRSLLFEHDCVIIPDFGGLLTRRSEAGYISNAGIYTPSRKKVAFNEVLKLDDGLLVYTISIHEKINREEASRLVREFVDKLRSKLAYKEEVVLKGIGAFTMNQEGKCVFEPDNFTNFDTEWYGLSELEAKMLQQESEIAEEIYPESTFTESFEPGKPVSKSYFQWAGWAAAAVMAGLLLFVGAYGETLGNIQGSANPFHSMNPVSWLNGISEGVKSVWSAGDETIAVKEVEMADNTVLTEEKADAVIIPAEEKEEISVLATVAESVPLTKRYELIVGSFTTMEAAETLKNEFIRKGYADAYIIEKGGRKFHKVAALNTDNLNEAYTLRKKLEKISGDGVWVFEDKAGRKN